MSHASAAGSCTHPRNVARRASVQAGPSGQPHSRILSWLKGFGLFLLLVGTLLGSGTSGVAQAASSQLQDYDAIGSSPKLILLANPLRQFKQPGEAIGPEPNVWFEPVACH